MPRKTLEQNDWTNDSGQQMDERLERVCLERNQLQDELSQVKLERDALERQLKSAHARIWLKDTPTAHEKDVVASKMRAALKSLVTRCFWVDQNQAEVVILTGTNKRSCSIIVEASVAYEIYVGLKGIFGK